MEKGKPDISQIDGGELKPGRFPRPDEPVYRVSIVEAALQAVKDHAEENTAIEVCGVLVGEVLKDEAGPFLVISAVIRGENAAAQAGQVTFTQGAWSHILEIKDAEFPDLRIVGWYHSHPAFGIFFSTQDQFIQTTLFSQPWQVALVVDPISGDEGFFVWRDGALARSGRFWIDGLPKSVTDPPNPGPLIAKKMDKLLAAAPGQGSRPEQNWFLPIYVISSLVMMGLLCLGVYLSVRSLNDRVVAFVEDFARAIAPPMAGPGGSIAEGLLLDKVAGQIRRNPLLASLPIRVAVDNKRVLCSGEVYTWAHKDLLDRVIRSVPEVGSVDLKGLLVTHIYHVVDGDTLEKIALRVYGDERQAERIYRDNRELIKDPKKIAPPLALRITE